MEGVEGQSSTPPGRYSFPPSRYSSEDILFCIDVSSESLAEMKVTGPNGRSITRLDSIKQAILVFINAKLTINPDHRFAFASLGKSASWLRKEFSSEVESAMAAFRGLSVDSSSGHADLTQLFRIAAHEAKKSRAQNRILRVENNRIWVPYSSLIWERERSSQRRGGSHGRCGCDVVLPVAAVVMAAVVSVAWSALARGEGDGEVSVRRRRKVQKKLPEKGRNDGSWLEHECSSPKMQRVGRDDANKDIKKILIYCRSSVQPQHQWTANQKLFTLDVVYLHDKPGPDNCPQKVYDALVDALENVTEYEGYILESGQGLSRVLFRHMCVLLSHPQQRCLQDNIDIPKSLMKKSPTADSATAVEESVAVSSQ
ncbi:hypothetical protein HYC85_021165 [Camellia sinensis]|uniref:BRISC and BRCA1-A complex member 1 n=1 Tax=Camellia sinensis TaxID=4442 RepID=A0A7J7GKU3_CAMSI|nr:hypothetical protein HYC85_021165 [Camellia sinensis]